MADQRNGPAVEAPVVHGVHVVEQVGHPDDGLAAVLGEEGASVSNSATRRPAPTASSALRQRATTSSRCTATASSGSGAHAGPLQGLHRYVSVTRTLVPYDFSNLSCLRELREER